VLRVGQEGHISGAERRRKPHEVGLQAHGSPHGVVLEELAEYVLEIEHHVLQVLDEPGVGDGHSYEVLYGAHGLGHHLAEGELDCLGSHLGEAVPGLRVLLGEPGDDLARAFCADRVGEAAPVRGEEAVDGVDGYEVDEVPGLSAEPGEEIVDYPAELDDARPDVEAVAFVVVGGAASSDLSGILDDQRLIAVLGQHGSAGETPQPGADDHGVVIHLHLSPFQHLR
jgi:hypothetical protein